MIDSETISNTCELFLADSASPAITVCAFAVHGFVDGYRLGANRGLSTALIHDKKAAGTVEGIEDLKKRIDQIKPKAYCIPDTISYRSIINAYVQYMKMHPERMNENYAFTLRDALESTYPC